MIDLRELKVKGMALKATEQLVDTGLAACKAFLDMLRVSAEFETNIRYSASSMGSAPPRRAVSTRAAGHRSIM